MRLRPTIWIAACLLLLAGALLLWRAQNHPAIPATVSHQQIVTTVHSSSTAPDLTKAQTTVAANLAENVTATVKTNPFAYRLSNTSKTIGQLTSDRHAILLENALIDTASPANISIPSRLRANGDAGTYIVQSRAVPNAAFHNLVEQTGARIISYIPNDAYLISASAAIADLLRGQPMVQAVIPYEPYYKFQSSLIGLAAENLPLPANTLLNLGLFNDNAAQVISQIEKMGGQVVAQETSPFGPVLIVKPPQDWTALAMLPSVGIIEPFRERMHANDLSRPAVGVAADSQVPTNYFGLTGSNVIVAVDDSGVDTNHPDFWIDGDNTKLRVLLNTPADGVDIDGHGTHVAGIIAGDGFESTTVTNAEGSLNPGQAGQFRGMAPLANILSLSFGNYIEGDHLSRDIGRVGSHARDAEFQQIAALTNALISNNSWNYAGDSEYDLAAASYDAATRDALPGTTGSQPVLFVFSAGNQGGGSDDGGDGLPDTILSPATAKNIITVGAVEQNRFITDVVTNADGSSGKPWQGETDSGYSPFSGSDPQVAAFSSRGNVGIGFEGQFGRYKPDVVAPGTFVVSARSIEWAANAYFNPTNSHVTSLADVLRTNAVTDPPFPIFAFDNAVSITITASSTVTNNLPIYLWEGTDPRTAPPDVVGNNSITITDFNPPPLNTLWHCAVSNTTAGNLPYTITVNVLTTNNFGTYYLVLSNLDQAIGDPNPDNTIPGPYYRYETGTSMSAADVSGVLALMADYFTNQLQLTPSPAMLKALLINGARPTDHNNYQIQNSINFEGWGQVNLPNSIQPGMTNEFDQACGVFFQDQSPTNALATGDTHTYYVTIDTNSYAQFFDFQFTLAWTDPPGNPAAAIKLVNNLDLVVSNMDTGDVYFGDDIPADSIYNNVWDTNSIATSTNPAAIADNINNIEQVILPGILNGGDLSDHYAVMVIGKAVNVNAVYQQTNNIVQDYALVMSSGLANGGVGQTNAFLVTDGGISNNATGYQNITAVTATNTPLFNQFVGASSPLLGTNQIGLTNFLYSTNGLITLGQTNQWHFYIVTNTGIGVDFTNAAFITFLPDTLALPRTGVYADTEANSTRTEADIDLYVTTDPTITNLNPVAIANADKSLGRGGTEFVTYTNSVSIAANPGSPSVYYVGVKSEDQMASEYAFIPIFTDIPFGQSNSNGDQYINGLNVPVNIPDGSPSHPGVGYVFAIGLQVEDIKRVVVTNIVQHQNFGDLVGVLSHADQSGGNVSVTLNSHDEITNALQIYPLVYDDSGQNDIPGTRTTDGPGSLNDFVGKQALGVWILSEIDNSQTQTGSVQNVSLFIEKHRDPLSGTTVSVSPHSWFYTYVDVPAGYTNLQLFGTNLPPQAVPPNQIQMYLRYNAQPDQNFYDFEADLTNAGPTGWGNEISDGPPLTIGRYFIGLFNSDSVEHSVYLLAALNGSLENIPRANWTTNNSTLLDDAVSSSTIFVPATNLIASLNVGLVAEHPRISDLSFTLISPTGQRILLMEDRGGPAAQNAGHLNILTNYFGTTTAGDANASTNIIGPVPASGTLLIDYDFFTVPDSIDVYYDGTELSGFPQTLSGASTLTIPYGPGNSTNIVVVMNPGGNTNSTTEWTYTPRVVFYDYNYLTFTEDTNLTLTPIKYAIPPFDLTDRGTNFAVSDFEQATAGDYFGPTNIFDPLGGWMVPTNILFSTNFFTNFVSVITDPHDAFVSGNTNLNGTNILALANGYIVRTNTLNLQRTYSISYQYRGPGIVGWWRGEGDALDSSDPERLGQNGSLIGRFDFPAGEVGQAFEFEDAGANFEFAGTNTYVQIRQRPIYTLTVTNDSFPPVLLQSTPLDVGAGGGMTVEGWINPTNIAHQEPLVEWLARVPTNGSDTNLVILAGPFLDRDTDHYYYMIGATNWTVSERWAQQLGGHLATVDTANEENWIFDTFANYESTNRNLWIGLTNDPTLTQFGWVGGETNVIYVNWATGQPTNVCDPANELYTVLLGPTNITPGLWAVADNIGHVCNTISSTNIYGVVEVPDIQTNGVQLWISATNYIGTTNDILDSVGNLYSNGCIYANLVDTSDSNHIFFSQPLLIQTNAYQYIALTYDTNSGIANLFYNGTNVATTNFGIFQPKTTGDVLLGKDMSREKYNFYGGAMDEMSIYNRALSDAEILAIYNDSVQSSNRNTGKFDPAQSPLGNLAEALVSLGDHTNIIFGDNFWHAGGFTFVAQTNSLVMQLLGLEPGILLDDFTVTETPIGNLYYLPEQSLDELKSTNPHGDWTLEVWDNRAGAVTTNSLISWQLEFILASNPPPIALNPEEPANITVPPNGFAYLTINVPDWASFATNVLVSASGPVDVWFNPTNLPTGNSPGDFETTNNSTGGNGNWPNGICSPDPLSATSNPPLPTNSYYVGIYNPNPHAVSATFEVDFDITGLSNGVPVTEFLNTNQSGRYFSFDVDSNAYEATFQLLRVSNNVDLVVRKGFPLPTLTSDDYGSFNVSNADENIFVLTNSSPVSLSAGRWYLGAFKRTTGVQANFTVLAKELTNNAAPAITIITLTNNVPFNFTAGPGAALTNFFLFAPTNTITPTQTNYVQAIRFELYRMTGNGDLTVQTDAPPFAPPFFESSQNPSMIPELIMVRTNNALTNLATDWYLGVPNHETNEINCTIIAVVETNGYFPAFPGAEGAGGGALGGSGAWRDGFSNRVYHVINLNDSGSGSLRDAVRSTNRTIVFDVSGILFLRSPLVITNSYLTIAGQTAPGGGVTVAGYMTELANVHDVIIRDLRFFTGGAFTNSGWGTDFEEVNAADYTNNQTFNNFAVTANQVSVVTDPINAYNGSNFLALANGTIASSLPTLPGQTYKLSFAYRGPGIASWWRAENNTNDSINGNNPSSANITFTNGEVGKAFQYDGSTSLIAVPKSATLPISNLTVEAWIYRSDSGTGRPVFDLGGPGQDSPVQLWINTTGGSSVNPGGLHAVIRNASGGGYEIDDANPVVVLNQWTHLALTATPSVGILYCNGIQVGSATATPLVPQSYTFADVGYRDTATGEAFVTAGRRFLGSIDEPSIYNRVLSASEIKAICAKGITGKFDSIIFTNSPALSLAEAKVSIMGQSLSIIFGNNTNWQTTNITFTATQYGTPLQISGVEPGVLLDSFSLAVIDTNTFAIATNGDALEFNNVSNVIADHISALWSTNTDVEILDSSNVTVQWSVISESLNATNVLHGYGARLRYGGGSLSLHHNLFADNAYASPRLGDDIQLDFVNNVIYGWGTNASFSANDSADNPSGFTNSLNYICNYLIASTNSLTNTIAFWSGSTNTWIFQTNNFIDINTNGILDGDDIGWGMFTNVTAAQKFDRPFPTVLPAIDEAFLAYERVLDFAGPDMDKRDWADTNIVENVRNQTGRIISVRPNLGLVAWWKGEGNALDSAGTNNGTLMYGAGYTNGEVDQAFNLPGASPSQHPGCGNPPGPGPEVVVPYNSLWNLGMNSFTIELWAKFNVVPSNLGHGIGYPYDGIFISDDAGVCDNNKWWFAQDGPVLDFHINSPSSFGGDFTVQVPFTPQTNQWYHFAVTRNGNLYTIYANGVVLGSVTDNHVIPDPNVPLTIGAGEGFYFNGRLDEVSIYNRALSQREIQQIYSIGRAGKFYTDVTPYLDTDQDGIPDFWEITFGMSPFVPNPNAMLDGSGYTELEEYLNWLAAPHALTVTNTSVGVDLQQTFGQAGNLSFYLTNAINGFVYLTNVLNYTNVSGTVYAVTNTGPFSNSFAIFMPTNNFNGTVTNYGCASFDVYVTNNNTIAYFGPVTVSVVVSKFPVRINTNMPPVITPLLPGVLDPTNYGGSDYYGPFAPTNNAIGIQFNVTNINPSGSADLVLAYNRLPSLSDYDYISTNPVNENIVVWTNSAPVPFTNGNWYAAVVNVDPNYGPVSYDIEYNEYLTVYPPLFTYPTNNIFTNIETTPFTLQCQAIDTNNLSLPLTYSIVTNVPGLNLLNVSDTNVMIVNPSTGLISWTPDEAQGPTTNSIAIRVSNGAYSATNFFTVIVEESNLPPYWPANVITNYTVNAQSTLVMFDAATNTDVPLNPLTYSLSASVLNATMDTNGVITWTPTVAQIGNYIFTNIVTDTNPWAINTQSFSATNYIFVTVTSALSTTNGLSQTNFLGAGGIDWFTVNVPTNADWATNTLLFATNLPVNLLFTTNSPPATNGAFTLFSNATNGVSILGANTSPDIIAGGTYYLGVQNTNTLGVGFALEVDFHLTNALAATNEIRISSISQTNNGFLLIWFAPTNDSFQVQETADLTPPVAWNTFSNIVTYTSLTSTNGIGLFEFFDDGSQFPFGPARFYRLLLLQPTNNLSLPNQTNFVANVSQSLAVTNTATDSNHGATLNYSLANFPATAPVATIDTNGIINWTPGAGAAGDEFKFTTIVTDNNLPPLSATNVFTVFVMPAPNFASAISTSTNVTLQWNAPTNDLFQVEWTTNLTPVIVWTTFPQIFTSTSGVFNFTDTNLLFTTKFYRLTWLPLP